MKVRWLFSDIFQDYNKLTLSDENVENFCHGRRFFVDFPNEENALVVNYENQVLGFASIAERIVAELIDIIIKQDNFSKQLSKDFVLKEKPFDKNIILSHQPSSYQNTFWNQTDLLKSIYQKNIFGKD